MGSGITSSTTEAELQAAYLENCTYLEENSTTKAAAFISVCRALLARPVSSGKGTFHAAWSHGELLSQIKAAKRWLEARDSNYRPGPTVRVFKDYR